MSKEELINVRGGGISASLLNALSRGAQTLYNFGATCGQIIKLFISGRRCN